VKSNKKEAAIAGGFFCFDGIFILFELGRDAIEFGVERAAQPINYSDDRNRNTGSD